jgi:hypothetical protein
MYHGVGKRCLTETDDMVAEAHWHSFVVGWWHSLGFDKIRRAEIGNVRDSVPVEISRWYMDAIGCSVRRRSSRCHRKYPCRWRLKTWDPRRNPGAQLYVLKKCA